MIKRRKRLRKHEVWTSFFQAKKVSKKKKEPEEDGGEKKEEDDDDEETGKNRRRKGKYRGFVSRSPRLRKEDVDADTFHEVKA
jgi:hypothetical protein